MVFSHPHNSQAKVWMPPGGAAKGPSHQPEISHSPSEGALFMSSQIQGLLPTLAGLCALPWLTFVLENPRLSLQACDSPCEGRMC